MEGRAGETYLREESRNGMLFKRNKENQSNDQ
jgi:uncharacterized C2H2 Zn-finger protein